jgi:hypothetical protein
MDNQRFKVNTPTVTHEIIDGEAVIINLDTGNYYSLSDVGAYIWGFFEMGSSANEIRNLVLQAYDGDATHIHRSVRELLTQLQLEHLIVEIDGAGDVFGLGQPARANNHDEKPLFNPPVLHKYSDMQELLLLDPIHDVDDAGWPKPVPDLPK